VRLVLNQKAYTPKEERDVLSALGRGLREEFPNPERVGCPDRDVISAIAGHRMPLPEAQKYLDHLGACSPCYRDFLELQRKYRQHRARMIFAAAASVLIVVGLATWAVLRQQNKQIASAVVDLRDRSIARGTEPSLSERPLEISRVVSRLEIYLPLGSGDGAYDVRVTTRRGETIFAGTSEAVVSGGITHLQVEADFSASKPGLYDLQLRKRGAEWASYPLKIK
jgi:hypothetical protein